MSDIVLEPKTEHDTSDTSFASRAEQPAPGIFREFWDFLRCNKKWWLLPIIVVLVLLAHCCCSCKYADCPVYLSSI